VPEMLDIDGSAGAPAVDVTGCRKKEQQWQLT
jgi:hypothetical protein